MKKEEVTGKRFSRTPRFAAGAASSFLILPSYFL
jgi:hypothetical protein